MKDNLSNKQPISRVDVASEEKKLIESELSFLDHETGWVIFFSFMPIELTFAGNPLIEPNRSRSSVKRADSMFHICTPYALLEELHEANTQPKEKHIFQTVADRGNKFLFNSWPNGMILPSKPQLASRIVFCHRNGGVAFQVEFFFHISLTSSSAGLCNGWSKKQQELNQCNFQNPI